MGYLGSPQSWPPQIPEIQSGLVSVHHLGHDTQENEEVTAGILLSSSPVHQQAAVRK